MTPAEHLLLDALLDADEDRAKHAALEYLSSVDAQTAPGSETRLYPTLYRRMAPWGVPTPTLLMGTYRQAWTKNQARFRAASSVITEFERAGITTVVLKGAALIPAYGGDWGARDMSDVDLLVPTAHVERAAQMLEADSWRPVLSTSAAAAIARHVHRRHSWNFERPSGANVDLHWHVFPQSRGPASDRDFFAATVALEVGSLRTARLCDADLLLHVLEHASRDDAWSGLMWIVDAVHVLRAADDIDALIARLARQTEQHDLVDAVDNGLERLRDAVRDPVVDRLSAGLRLRPRPRRRPLRLADYRRGGTSLVGGIRAWSAAELDAGLTTRPVAWRVYVATGRRPSVERLLVRNGRPLSTVPGRGLAPAREGWWNLWEPDVCDALCGAGWSYPEKDAEGVWTDGPEARLVLPSPLPDGTVSTTLEMFVLGRSGGPARLIEVRCAGATLATLEAAQRETRQTVTIEAAVSRLGTVDLSIRVRDPGRPIDLGIGRDARRLGIRLRRVQVAPVAAGQAVPCES